MPPALDVFCSGYLTLKSSTIGRLVIDVRNPGDDFCPATDDALPEHEVEPRHFDTVRAARSTAANAGLGAKLTQLFTADLSLEGSNSDELDTRKVTRYHLLQHQSYFRKLCAGKATREWMETAIQDSPLFLVVGLITVQDAEAQAERQRQGQAAVSGEVPVGEAAGIPDPEGVTNVGMNLHGGGSSGQSISFIAPGERVIGVRYRKLKFRMLKKKSVDTASLENNSNRWEMFTGGDRASEEDIIEADFEDELEEDGLECDADDEMVIDEVDDV
ncbi:hypothetical protein CEP54_008278 [Fusarium duplospermum]|uniref:Uncharacterized protein n=1 Tax=Fusarium duplospermum TaxID=1325734 RepID=A0A428PWW5_9HYPO|nr:hypothetical protein CEP54_008278 [Fusarium duplospermum]